MKRAFVQKAFRSLRKMKTKPVIFKNIPALLYLLLLLSITTVKAQNINTVAGGGSGDGNIATAASLYYPYSVAFDGSGNMYIADVYHNIIRKVAAGTGIISTIAGSGTQGYSGDGGAATSAEFYLPTGVRVDLSGNIYVVDYGNNRIRKIIAGTGIITTVVGNGSTGYSGDGGAATAATLGCVNSITLDNSGNIFLADAGNNVIRKVAAGTGIITTIVGDGNPGYSGDNGQASAAELNNPFCVALDGLGNLYISDYNNNVIRKVAAGTNVISTVAGNGSLGYSGDGGQAANAQLNNPYGLVLDGSGNLYIADTYNNCIRKVTAATGVISTIAGNGTLGFSGDGGAATTAELNYPYGIALDGSGNLYIADVYNNRIREVAGGIITTVAGGATGSVGDGSAATNALLSAPAGVAVDGAGNLYIADHDNHRVRKVAAGTGIISTVAGTGTAGNSGDGSLATAAQLNTPSGVALDGSGNLYIADESNNNIRKVTVSSGNITTIAGSGAAGFSGDGHAGTTAQLSAPLGIAIDGSGNFYIAYENNNRIRKITVSTGIISTIAGTGSAGNSGDGAAATSAQLNLPSGIAVDGFGNIYIADKQNNTVRKIAVGTNTISTVAGNGTGGYSGDDNQATTAQLNFPTGVALDGSGNIYIADEGNNVIRKIVTGTGVITTIAGTGVAGFLGDAGLAVTAEFHFPRGITLDAAGNGLALLTHGGNNRIRKVDNMVSITTGEAMISFLITSATTALTAYPNPFNEVVHLKYHLNNNGIRNHCID